MNDDRPHPLYQGAHFLTAAAGAASLPPDQGREVAFAGRSNAGKSSAINTLCHQRALARTSKTPGRTQQLIFFRLDDERRLVDLPGYGYAKVAVSIKQQWQAHLAAYLEQRRALSGLVLVMDIRHPLTPFDQQLLRWRAGRGLPVLALLTKADKLKQGAARAAVRAVEQTLAKSGATAEGVIQVLPFSATARTGVADVHAVLDGWLAPLGPPPSASL